MTRGRLAGGLVLVALVLLPSLVTPYVRNTLTEALIFAIFAMSLDLLLGYTGLISFGHAAFFGVGAYAAGIAGTRWGPNLFFTFPVALAASAAAALLIGPLAIRGRGVYFLMLTLAFAQMVHAIAYKWTWLTGGTNGLAGVPRPALPLPGTPAVTLGGDLPFAYFVLATFLLTLFLLWRITRSPFGRTLIGLRENEARMRGLGYPTARYKLAAFVLAGVFGGLAGALYVSYSGFISPGEVYWTMSGTVLVMVIVGGAGTLVGPALGAVLVLLLQNQVSSLTERWPLIMGAIFIGFVLRAPQGIAGLGRALARIPKRMPCRS